MESYELSAFRRDGLSELSHLQESHLFGSEEAIFAAGHFLLSQTGERHAVEAHYFVSHFLEDTTYHTILTRVDLEAYMTAIVLGKLECIRHHSLVIQHHAGTYDGLIHLIQVVIKRHGIYLLLVELRMGQFGSQIAVVGEQEHTGGVTIQPTYRVDTLGAGITHDVDHRVALLGIVGGGDCVLGFVEQDIHLALTTNRLIVETDVVGGQHLGAKRRNGLTIYGDHSGLYKIIGLATAADAGIGQKLIQTDRLGRILHLLTIMLALALRIDCVVALYSRTERTVLSKCVRSRFVLAVATEAGTSRNRFVLSAKTRTRSALTFIVKIIVVHVWIHYAYTHVRALIKYKVKRQEDTLSPFISHHSPISGFSFLNCQFTTIVATAGANRVVDVKCATVRACSQCRSLHNVMRTTFRLAGVRLSSFRMCHIVLQF